MPKQELVVLVMGVAGSGKTTIGRLLAASIGCAFVDADDYHSDANKLKMSRGEPLTDEDRAPWLAELRDVIAGTLARGGCAVLACSALKQCYREIEVRLTSPGAEDVLFLDVTPGTQTLRYPIGLFAAQQ